MSPDPAIVTHGDYTFRRCDPKSSEAYRVSYGGFEIGTVERVFEGGSTHRWLCRAPYPSPFDEADPTGEARLWKIVGSKKRTRLDSAKELLLIHQIVRGIA